MGDGDGRRYVRVDVILGRMIAARRSLRIISTLILVDLVLPIFIDILHLAFCVLTGKVL